MAGPGDLDLLQQELLEAAVEALDTLPTYDPALGGAPDRYFVSPAQPAYECCDPGQLTVHRQAITATTQAPQIPKAALARINDVGMFATILRCVPTTKEAPETADMESAAAQINADAWALWNHIFNLIVEGLLFDQCKHVIWGGIVPIPMQGGCGGNILTITVSLDGYSETFGS